MRTVAFWLLLVTIFMISWEDMIHLGGRELFTGRYTATGFNVNDVGLTVALGIPVAWHLAVSEGGSKMIRRLRLANYIYIPVAVLAIFLTASRGSLIAAIPAILFVVASLPRLRLFQRVVILAALMWDEVVDTDLGEAILRKGPEVYPESRSVSGWLRRLEDLLRSQGRWEEAQTAIEGLERLDEGSESVCGEKIQISTRHGDHGKPFPRHADSSVGM